jgi:hypothetical protein
MYSNTGYTTFTNNPFIDDPSNPSTRFPDISATSSTIQGPPSAQYSPWAQDPTLTSVYQPQVQQQASLQLTQYTQQLYAPQQSALGAQPIYSGPGSMQQQPMPSHFQPSSSFGQQLVQQVNGSGYGYLQGQSGGYQSGYGDNNLGSAQQQVQNPGYIAQFDPYSPLGQGWDGQVPSQTQTSTGHAPGTTQSSANPHPRDYIRTHKVELEQWDSVTWKQLFNTFETLGNAWDLRKKELEGRLSQLQSQLQFGGGYYAGQIQQEQGRLQEVSYASLIVFALMMATSEKVLKQASSNNGTRFCFLLRALRSLIVWN